MPNFVGTETKSSVSPKTSVESKKASSPSEDCSLSICEWMQPAIVHDGKSQISISQAVEKYELHSDRSSFLCKTFKDLKISFANFTGLIAPVFTCFKNDATRTIDLMCIKHYASWLKQNHVNGILVNSFIGEIARLSLEERKLIAEIWSREAMREALTCIVQIGCCSLPEVLDMAKHAHKISVNAVFCLPNLNSLPKNMDELITYLQGIAAKCRSIPFFYTHDPDLTNLDFDMVEFCERAEESIPNFFGIQYASSNLDKGARCIRNDRIIFLSTETLMAAGLILGFETFIMTWVNISPSLCHQIKLALENNDLPELQNSQQRLCHAVWQCIESTSHKTSATAAMKERFNAELKSKGIKFTTGPSRIDPQL